MSLDDQEVEKIAHLARMALSPEESSNMGNDLSKILDMVAQLESVDVGDVEPMAHPLHMSQRLRPDEVTEENRRDVFQKNAPAVEDGLFLVPRVIE